MWKRVALVGEQLDRILQQAIVADNPPQFVEKPAFHAGWRDYSPPSGGNVTRQTLECPVEAGRVRSPPTSSAPPRRRSVSTTDRSIPRFTGSRNGAGSRRSGNQCPIGIGRRSITG